MKRRARGWSFCAVVWLGGGPFLGAASIEGVVALPKARPTSVVVVERYNIKTNGGVIATDPPLAVVYVEGRFPATSPAPQARIRQEGLTFIPSLLPIEVGTRVEFLNLDDTYHNIFSYSAPKRFDLGRYLKDDRPVPSEVFDVPGLVTLRCDVHEHMRGVILVLPTPYFTVTDAGGKYALAGLPAGDVRVKAWLNSKTVLEKTVTLEPDGVMRVDFAAAE